MKRTLAVIGKVFLSGSNHGARQRLTAVVFSLIAVFGAPVADAELWDSHKSTDFAGWVDWMENAPYFATYEALIQGAEDWCKTTSNYVDPAKDCKYIRDYNPPTYYPPGVSTHGPFWQAILVVSRDGGSDGLLKANWWLNDTTDESCPGDQVVDRADGHGCIDPNRLYTLEKPKENVDPEMCTGNPCDPATGIKTQTEVDFRVAAEGVPSFARYYSSKGSYRTGLGMAPGWRHTYSRELDEEPDRNPTVFISSPADQSSFYHSVSAACSQGWDDIKVSVFAGGLGQATGTLVGGNTCKISEGGQAKAFLRVRAGGRWVPFTPPSSNKTVVRPNGSTIEFEQDGGNWIAPLNGTVSLEQVGSQWIFTDASDVRETYDSSGRLVAITQRNGQTETLDYELTTAQGGDDDSTTLDRVTGPFGHSLSFAYDTNGQLASVATPDGTFSYALGAGGNLVSVTYPDTSVRQYVYEDTDFAHHLTGIIDENLDRFATWAYDDAGRAVLSEHAGGKESVTLTYNANGTTTIVSGNGASSTYTFGVEAGRQRLAGITGDVCSDCAGGNIKSRTYDTNGFLDEATDWNDVVTKTVRNSRGLVETLTEALGTTEERVTTSTWHASYRLPLAVAAPQYTTTYTYDASGNMLSASVSGGGASRAISITYDSNGQPLTINGPRTDAADVTTFVYYNCTTGSECGQLQSVTNAFGHVTTFDTYDSAGRVTKTTGPNGLETSLAYDARGRVLTVVETPAVGAARTTTFTYDAVGQLVGLTLPNGEALTYTYDAAHYLTTITDGEGNSIRYTYDAMGRMTAEEVVDPNEALVRSMAYTRDLAGRLDTISIGNYVTDVTIDQVGNRTSETDAANAVTQHVFDALNRPKTTTDALSGSTGYVYDDHDNVTQVTAPNGAATTYIYDGLDNLSFEVSPDRGTLTYTYDDAGNRLSATDARGITATYAYDALNRLTSITYPDSSENVTLGYDVAASNGVGRLTSVVDQSGTTTYTYDGFGNIATAELQTMGATLLTSYTYDAADNIASVTYPSGRIVTYTRSANGEIVQVSSDFGGIVKTIVSSAAYDASGSISSIAYGNGLAIDYQYELDGRVSAITGGSTIEKSYGFDAVGNVTSLLDSIDGSQNQSFAYDALSRLIAEEAPAEYASRVLVDNPVGYWRLGETSGSTAYDSSGNGHHGTYSQAELGHNSLVGDDDTAMRAPSNSTGYVHGMALTGVTVKAAEGWFQSEASTQNRDILLLHNSTSDQVLVYHHADGYLKVYMGGGLGWVMISDNPVTINEPHHFAVWYELATDTSYLSIDGITQRDTHTGNVLATVDPLVYIGAYRGSRIVDRFKGILDEIAVYDDEKSAATFANRVLPVGQGSQTASNDFTYDANGNRTGVTKDSGSESYTYTTGSNVLDSIDSAMLQHDVAGNRISDAGGIRTYGYDDTGRLDEFFDNGVLTASYVHNAMGQRVQKTVGATTTIYIYNASGNLLAEHDSNGTLIRDYVWMNGVPVAQIDQGEVFSYLHFDHLGTPRLATDDTQAVVWRWDSDAFGSTAANDDPDGNGTPLTVNLRFPGQYFDVETGFHYNYFRTYDPSTGRYLESDPIGLNGGLNTYTYVGNMPTTYVDPFGLDAVPAPVPLPIYIPPVAFPGTPENDAFVDAVNGIINGLSDTGLGCPWYQAVCISDPMYNESSDDSESCPTPDSHPDEFDKLRGDQGYRPKDKKGKNERWKKDRLHGDHWDVSDKKGRKIKEIDFDGNQIWPGGPKNKNKK